MTDQVFLRNPTIAAVEVEDRCQRADILAARTLRTAGVLDGQPGGVIRVSVQEITRQGLTEPDMPRIAGLIAEAVNARRSPEDISQTIAEWMSGLGPSGSASMRPHLTGRRSFLIQAGGVTAAMALPGRAGALSGEGGAPTAEAARLNRLFERIFNEQMHEHRRP